VQKCHRIRRAPIKTPYLSIKQFTLEAFILSIPPSTKHTHTHTQTDLITKYSNKTDLSMQFIIIIHHSCFLAQSLTVQDRPSFYYQSYSPRPLVGWLYNIGRRKAYVCWVFLPARFAFFRSDHRVLAKLFIINILQNTWLLLGKCQSHVVVAVKAFRLILKLVRSSEARNISNVSHFMIKSNGSSDGQTWAWYQYYWCMKTSYKNYKNTLSLSLCMCLTIYYLLYIYIYIYMHANVDTHTPFYIASTLTGEGQGFIYTDPK